MWYRHIILVLFGLAFFSLVSAQELPVLPADPVIRTGTLQNGTHYYVVPNNTVRGIADFALVQKTGKRNIPDTAAYRAVEIARDALAAMPRCTESSVQNFFTSHGVTPDRNGFVKITDNSTEFRFKDVLLSNTAVVDSTLLVLMDIIDRVSLTDDEYLRKWYSPSDQAVVVSGDINADDIVYKLRMLSLMTPFRQSSPRIPYQWKSVDTAGYVSVCDTLSRLATVSATWKSSRTPSEYMNTVQPVIYEMFIYQLAEISQEGIRKALAAKGIPVADVKCVYALSAQTNTDESFKIDVAVSKEHLSEAVATVSQVMGSIEKGYTAPGDIARVKQICVDEAHDQSNRPLRSNSAIVDKCIASFLYNGSLATLKSKVDFLVKRKLDNSVEHSLFNKISSALLDSAQNLTIRTVGDLQADSVKNIFESNWGVAQEGVINQSSPRELPAFIPSGAKIKIRTTKVDPMSGGSVWTFSNGFTVIHKKMNTGGRVYFNLSQNEGFASMKDLERGEGAYISDQFFWGRIAGMKGQDFLNLLNENGMSMKSNVGISHWMLSGYAPEEKMDMMMRAILSALYQRSPDEETARYNASCEPLRQAYRRENSQDIAVVIDSIMCPGYKYSSMKTLEELPVDLHTKAQRYFDDQSLKMNDGVLILLSDLDEEEVKKVLLRYGASFKTSDKAFKRSIVRYQPASGWSVYTVKGRRNAVNIAMSMPMALTTDNFMAAQVAAMLLKKRMSDYTVNTGLYLEVYHDCKIYPQERLSMLITLNEANPEGFASGTVQTGAIEALAGVRTVLAEIPEMQISQEDMNVLKTQLKDRLALEMKTPFYWLNSISRRYLAGKDFTTSYQAKIDAVTPDKVKSILESLNEGTKVEYIIKRD